MKRDDAQKIHVFKWLADSLPREVREKVERLAQTNGVLHVAIMPDVHLSEDICIGTVFAADRLLFPGAIGTDLGCGMAAMKFQVDPAWAKDSRVLEILWREIRGRIPIARHSRRTLPSFPAERVGKGLSSPRLKAEAEDEGILEFATLGCGNHFLEFQLDEPEDLWVMVHTGSRAMGARIRTHHLALGRKTKTGFPALEADSPEGEAFLSDLDWAMEYARASRREILKNASHLVSEVLGGEPLWGSLIDSCHNSILRETHFGKPVWVHRKGANSANKGEPGIIPGSMGSESYLVLGRGCPESLNSSSHGAGRRMSRQEARKTISPATFQKSMEGIWFDRGSARKLLEEAPTAYKDIRAILRAQKDLVKIHHRLRPVVSFKGGS
jgi:tRNA-splicing ligase RtcB